MASSAALLASKIVVVEEPPRIRNVTPVPTAIPGFLGVAEKGPIGQAVYITSFDKFVDIFGSYIADSDLAINVEGFFVNGGSACWVARTVHYTDITDPNTKASAAGSMNIVDRGGAAAPAVLDSVDGPYDLEPGEVLEVNIDGAGADSLTFTATPASITSGNTQPFALVNGDTLVYRVKMPGSASFSELRTITFVTGDFVTIGAATAQEVANVINRDGIGIKAILVGATSFKIESDKRGADADLDIDASSTSISAGKLNLASGVTSGSGNVDDIDLVTATEIAGLLTALPLSSGTAVAVGAAVRLTSTGTGIAASVVVTTNTTAGGIFAGTLPITENGSDAGTTNTLKIEGKTDGPYINSYSIGVTAATNGESDQFDLRVLKNGVLVELWPNLSMTDADANYVEDVINDATLGSNVIVVTDLDSPASSPNDLPAIGTYSSWSGANDGLTGLADADFIGSSAGPTGLHVFSVVQNLPLLVVPGRSGTAGVADAMLTYAEVTRKGRTFAILDPPEGLSATDMKTYQTTTAALYNKSEFGCIYWPRMQIVNPSTAVFGATSKITVPVSGYWAGVMARNDTATLGGVYKAPAGILQGRIFGVVDFETEEVLDEAVRDLLYPVRVNPINQEPGAPIYVDGNRTLSNIGSFPTIGERRGVIFIENSLANSLLFAKHRNNDWRLRREVEGATFAFLLIQFGNEAFRGVTPPESFFVDVSDELNPPEIIYAGQLRMRIGLATQKPLDFLILIFTQDTRALEERLAQAGLGR